MEIVLSGELETFVQSQVRSGSYLDPGEVVRAGLRLLLEQEQMQRKKDELRREIDVGLEQAEQGKVVPLTQELIEQIKTRGRQRRTGNAEQP